MTDRRTLFGATLFFCAALLIGQCGGALAANICKDGQPVPADGVCKQTCADGSQVPETETCPAPAPTQFCRDGQPVPGDSICLQTCPDGTRIPENQNCSEPTEYNRICKDGRPVPADGICKKACPDGSQVPEAQRCGACPGGMIGTPGDCRCPDNTRWNPRVRRCVPTTTSTCPGGMVGSPPNGCHCPDNAPWNPNLHRCASASRGWIGVRARTVTPEIADRLGLRQARGALVIATLPDSPAQGAGIVSGDVITQLDGIPVSGSRDLVDKISNTPPGNSIRLTIIHNGARRTLTLIVGELKGRQPANDEEGGPERKGGIFGAIVYSPESGASGYAYNMPSREEALQRAHERCGQGCRSVTWFKNACGALAVGRNNGWGLAWNRAQGRATMMAMEQCEQRTSDCRVKITGCAGR